MLWRIGDYIVNDVGMSLYSTIQTMQLYPAEGVKQVKHLIFIDRFNYEGYMRLFWKIYFLCQQFKPALKHLFW